MKKTIAILLVAIMAVGSAFAAFSGEASLGFGGNLDNGNYGFIDSAAKVKVDVDLATADAEAIADGEVYASIKGSLILKVYSGEESTPEFPDPNDAGQWNVRLLADVTEAKVAGENWEVSILGLDDAPNYAKGFQTYTVEDGVDKWGFERADFDENYNTSLPFEKATGIQATVFGFKAGFGLVGDYDDSKTWEFEDAINLAALVETPEFDFSGFKFQVGGAYSYKSFKKLQGGAVVPLDAGTARTNALSVSAKAGYATDALSVMAATDVAFKFDDKDTTVDADVTLDVVYDFLTVNAYYGTNPVTGKEPKGLATGYWADPNNDSYNKTTSEDMLSTQVKVDLNSFNVPVALTVGMNDIIAKQSIVAKAEITAIEGLKLTVNGGYTIDEDGRTDVGNVKEVAKDKGRDFVGKWSAGLDAEYDMDIMKVTAGISAEQRVEKDAKVKLGLNAAVESDSIIPGATIKLAWADAEDILKAENDGAKELGKITASIKMTF